MYKKLMLALSAGLILSLSLPLAVLAGLTYEGSSTIGENVLPQLVKAFAAKTGIKFDSIGIKGSGEGYKQAMAGTVSVGGMSRALKYDEKKAKPYYQIIGYDAIAVYVHKNNPVSKLSKEQLKGIFTGQIKNWKEVGGNDAAINVVTEIKSATRATIEAFQKDALDGAEYGPSKEIDKPHDCVLAVRDDVNAITHASLAFKSGEDKVVTLNEVEASIENVRSGAYMLSRPLLLICKDIPGGDLQKFFEFVLSDEGQRILKEKFVSVR